MSQTVNYGLNIYTDNEVENLGTVRTWRSKLDGTGSDSNMVKIDAALKSIADSIPTNVVYVEANPTLAGTESVLNSIKIGSTKYKIPSIVANETLSGNETTVTSLTINGTKYAIPQGTTITANPTLDGTETDLEGIGIGGVNYAIPSGGGSSGGSATLYEHNITLVNMIGQRNHRVTLKVKTTDNAPFTLTTLRQYLYNNGFTSNTNMYEASGYATNDSGATWGIIAGAIGTSDNNGDIQFMSNSGPSYTYTMNTSMGTVYDIITQIQVGTGSGGGGTSVEANPTLDGTETTLTGLSIGGTNYAMPHLYEHNVLYIFKTLANDNVPIRNKFTSTSNTPLTKEECYNKIMELKYFNNSINNLWIYVDGYSAFLTDLYDYGYSDSASGGSTGRKLDGKSVSIYFRAYGSSYTSASDTVTQIF